MRQLFLFIVLLFLSLSSLIYAHFEHTDIEQDLCLNIETGNFEPCQYTEDSQLSRSQVVGIETGNIEPDFDPEPK